MPTVRRRAAPVGLAAALQALLATYAYLGRRLWGSGW